MTDPMIVRRTLAVQLVHAVRTLCGVRGLKWCTAVHRSHRLSVAPRTGCVDYRLLRIIALFLSAQVQHGGWCILDSHSK